MIFSNLSKMKSGRRDLLKSGFKFLFLNGVGVQALAADLKTRVTILPLITFYSTLEEGEVYNWWAENDSLGDMNKLSDQFYTVLHQHPLSRWQYISSNDLVKDKNPLWQISALSDQLKTDYAKFRKAGLVVSGDVRVSHSPLLASGVRLTQNLQVLRVKTGEVIAESLRISDIPQFQYNQIINSAAVHSQDFILSTFSDLHEKIEAYKPRSAQESRRAQLVLTGSFSAQQLEAFKRRLQASNPSITRLQTVSLERDQVIFQLDGIQSEALAQLLSQLQWKGLRTQVISTDPRQVVFDVKPRTGVF